MTWLSASQVDTFDLCPRKWAWRILDGVPTKIRPSTELGTAVHAQLEAWLRNGTPVDITTEAGRVAMQGLHLLPAPGTVEVEKNFELGIGVHRFRGLKDVQDLYSNPPRVMDHKTTSNLSYALEPRDMPGNIQAALYAADAMYRAQANACDLAWVYYPTRGTDQARKVHLRVTRDDITPTLVRIVRHAEAMLGFYESGCSAKDVPANIYACSKYGGCDFLDNCAALEPKKEPLPMSTSATNDFLARLKAKRDNAGAINPPAQPANGGHVVAPPDPPGVVVLSPLQVAAAKAAAPPTRKHEGVATTLGSMLGQIATALEAQAQALRSAGAIAAQLDDPS